MKPAPTVAIPAQKLNSASGRSLENLIQFGRSLLHLKSLENVDALSACDITGLAPTELEVERNDAWKMDLMRAGPSSFQLDLQVQQIHLSSAPISRHAKISMILSLSSRFLRQAARYRKEQSISALYSTAASQSRATSCDPLRILFCGSDEFSIASLRPIADLKKQDSSIVESVDVLCRKDKRTGHKFRQLSQVPVKVVASSLGLPLHQIDAFAELDQSLWDGRFNLIVAVSFGLLIPAPLIRSAKYGGLNLHPSLLPDLPGAAPIAHTILQGRSHTGVTLQTLHPTKFDRGQIIAQTPLPGIPVSGDPIPSDLRETLGQIGASMLRDALERRTFVPPIDQITHTLDQISRITDGKGVAKAPKVTKADMEINWDTMTAAEIVKRLRVFGKLWDSTLYERLSAHDSGRRIVYHDARDVSDEAEALDETILPGFPFLLQSEPSPRVVVKASGGSILEILDCTIAGKKSTGGAGLKDLIRLLKEIQDTPLRSAL